MKFSHNGWTLDFDKMTITNGHVYHPIRIEDNYIYYFMGDKWNNLSGGKYGYPIAEMLQALKDEADKELLAP